VWSGDRTLAGSRQFAGEPSCVWELHRQVDHAHTEGQHPLTVLNRLGWICDPTLSTGCSFGLSGRPVADLRLSSVMHQALSQVITGILGHPTAPEVSSPRKFSLSLVSSRYLQGSPWPSVLPYIVAFVHMPFSLPPINLYTSLTMNTGKISLAFALTFIPLSLPQVAVPVVFKPFLSTSERSLIEHTLHKEH
jgi:hypothetical protein